MTNVIGPAKVHHLSAKIIVFVLSYLNKCLYCHNKVLITTAKFNGLSSAAYRNGLLHSELKISAKIELSVTCAQIRS